MAKPASGKKGGTAAKPRKTSTRKASSGRARSPKSQAGDAFISLLQSPLVADLVAVAASSALGALASHRGNGKGTGQAVKKAGKAAADAVKRRLTEEVDAIKQAAKDVKAAKGSKA